jgi:hypothetical protein
LLGEWFILNEFEHGIKPRGNDFDGVAVAAAPAFESQWRGVVTVASEGPAAENAFFASHITTVTE